MSLRRVLVQAVAESSAPSRTAAAAVAVQMRCCLHPSRITQAPRQKPTAKKPKATTTAATPSKRTKAKTTPPPLEVSPPQSEDSHSPQQSDNRAAETRTEALAVGAVDSSADPSPLTAASAQDGEGNSFEVPSVAEDMNSGVDTPVHAVAATDSDGISFPPPPPQGFIDAASATAAAAAAASAAALTTRPSQWYADGRQLRLLVGAHAALEGTADCPDPRQHIPRLVTEVRIAAEAGETAAAGVAGSRVEREQRAGSVVHRLLPPLLPEMAAATPAASSAADAAARPLPIATATSIFADTFAFTLHRIPLRWQALAAATTTLNAVLPSTVGADIGGISRTSAGADEAPHHPAASAAVVATGALSFLSSPLSAAAAGALSARSPHVRTTAMGNLAPLHWLEDAFCALCHRIAQEVRTELREASTAGKEEEDEETDSGAGRLVRAQATAVMAALESRGKCAGSRAVLAMRRAVQRQKAMTAAPASALKSRKSTRHGTAATTDAAAKVDDTLLNTVSRVGLELHLLHVWLTRLSVAAPADDSSSINRAPTVEAVIRQAASWGAHCEHKNNGRSSGGAVPSVVQLEWMLATAMLEQLHVQTYRFHISHVSSAMHMADLASEEPTRRLYVVGAREVNGLAALVDFALAERVVNPSSGSGGGVHEMHGGATGTPITTSTTTALQESLLALLNTFHTVLPVYAVLQPAWQCLLAEEGAPAFAAALEGKSSGGVYGKKQGDASELQHAADPAAVWDVVVRHWTQEEAETRMSGALAALWWLRVLPLWMNTATCTLQLRLVAAAVRAVTATPSATTAATEKSADTPSTVVMRAVVESLEAQLERAGDVLRGALRFDRALYERGLSTAASRDTAGGGGANGAASGAANGTRGTTGRDGAVADREGEMSGADAAGDGLDSAPAPPPLQRSRGKRSLFFRDGDATANTILQGNETDDRRSSHGGGGGAAGRRAPSSRFSSRQRGVSSPNTLVSPHGGGSSGAPGGRDNTSPSSTADAHTATSALFDVLAMSRETPTVLTHRFSCVPNRDRERDHALEETWAATARARTELWMALFALPSAAAVEAATTRATSGEWSTAQVLRSCLPPALRPFLAALRAAPSSTDAQAGDGATAAATAGAQKQKKQTKAAAQTRQAGDRADAVEESVLREALAVIASVQQQLGVGVFEALDHLLMALADVLLRISNSAAQGNQHFVTAREAQRRQRAVQQLHAVLSLGTDALLSDNLLGWESTQSVWQLRQLHCMPQLSAPQGGHKGRSAAVFSVVSASAAMGAFATQWTAAVVTDLPLLFFRFHQDPGAVLANAKMMLTALQKDVVVGALPLYAKQVTLAAVLQSLRVVLSPTRQAASAASKARARDRSSSSDTITTTTASTTAQRAEVKALFQQLLDTLAADADARLLCCYAAFVDNLYEVHQRVHFDHAALIAWADEFLLPLILPVVVAGLRRSLDVHSAAAHFSVCEATLVLLSPLSRFATSPETALVDVLRSRWTRVLLQVSLYCIRVTGRGGLKRAADYGMPPVVLPDALDAPPGSASAWWTANFAHGSEPMFLRLLDHSNSVLWGTRRAEPYSVDAASGMRGAFGAYVAAWGAHVRFGRRSWATAGAVSTPAASSPAETHLAWLLRCSADVEAYGAVTEPARTAGAEAMPFLAATPAKARQLGYLVRFMEHHLREQERLSRVANDLPTGAVAVPSSAGGAAALNMVDALGETAALVLLDFVGHLSSAGGWAMVTWTCNVAETVVKIELKRHRVLPETARVVAATAILSQIRTVPPPREGAPLPANLTKALFTLSDLLCTHLESLFGFPRRSPLHGLFAHSTRDQYRVLTFGLKQATAYVQLDSRKYRAWQDTMTDAAEPSPQEDNEGEGDVLVDVVAEVDAGVAAMSRSVGRYYTSQWTAHQARERGEPVDAAAVAESRRQFTYYVGCLVTLVDACMEWTRLFLVRQQGDGEEDLRVVMEAAVTELCRTLSANLQSVTLLTDAQRRACFASEEAQLLWAALCVASTLSITIPLDQKDRFFSPRCLSAVQRLLERVGGLVECVTRAAAAADTGADATRPLCTALVCGAQHLLRDPRSSQRLAIRLAIRQRDEDDLTAVLDALHVQLLATQAYKPGSALLCTVWERLSSELTQPLAPPSGAAKGRKKNQQKQQQTALFAPAATVASRSAYEAALRGMVAAYTAQRRPTPSPVPAPDVVALATQRVVEDAAAVQADRQRGRLLATHGTNAADASEGEASPLLLGHDTLSGASLPPPAYSHINIAAALESGTMPLSAVLDAAVAHAQVTLTASRFRASLWRSAAATSPVAAAVRGRGGGGGGGDTDDDNSGSSGTGSERLLRDYLQDMVDLVEHVPLRTLLTHPNAEVLFAVLPRLEGVVAEDAEAALWRALTLRWRAELLEPAEATFLPLQQSQLALIRASRSVQAPEAAASRATGGLAPSEGAPHRRSHSELGASTPPLDMFAFDERSSNEGGDTIAAAALAALQDHWFPEQHSMRHHDDARRIVSGTAAQRTKSKSGAPSSQEGDETFVGEFDADATGLAALAAMPDPVPLPVLLTLLTSLTFRASGADTHTLQSSKHAAAQKNASSWLAAGGSASGDPSSSAISDVRGDGGGAADANGAVATFVETLVTYVARAYWLLRPRLDDNTFLVWATVERSMAVYPTAHGTWQQQWDRLCRAWRLPSSTSHTAAVSGVFLSAPQRRRVAAWCAHLRHNFPSLSHVGALTAGREEEAVLCYMRSTAAYTHLLSLTMRLLMRHRMLGDLISGSEEVVAEQLRGASWKGGGRGDRGEALDEHSLRAMRRTAVLEEVRRLAEERQTRQDQVNRNLLEGAVLQYLNVVWTLIRHSDALTHHSTDVILSQLTQTPGGRRGGKAQAVAPPAVPQDPRAVHAYTDELRRMVVATLQDSLSTALSTAKVTRAPVVGTAIQTLLVSGFSCDPLLLRVPPHHHHTKAGAAAGAGNAASSGTAPAVTVVTTLLDAVGAAATMTAGRGGSGGGDPSLSSPSSTASLSNAYRALSPITRAELYVGSPTLLALLTPHFTQETLLRTVQFHASPNTLQPLVSSLDHYLSRHGLPLSPLLEATTELLTCGAVRSSAVHTYCEHLASELVSRKEFRQALEPPTIASVEQGGAGSISNEVVIAFVAAVARHDVHVTKKTLAMLLHFIMAKRLDVFGQPPTANRQGKLTLVQVGTTVDTTIDTTNPLYAPRSAKAATSGAHTGANAAEGGAADAETPATDDDDVTSVMEAFNVDYSTDFTAMTHHKALAALTINLPTVLEVAMHLEALRSLDPAELRRARQMLKAADDARRERVAVHRSHAQMATTTAASSPSAWDETPEDGGRSSSAAGERARRGGKPAAPVGALDASLHLEDPLDYGVAVLHLRYALRKVVHASLRRLLHQQGPRMLAEVAEMLQMVDAGMQLRPNGGATAPADGKLRGGGGSSSAESDAANQRHRPYDGILAGTTRVLLSRAVLCAQGIGYDRNGAMLELATPSAAGEGAEGQPVLKLPVPELQVSAVEAAMSAMSAVKGRHVSVGTSSGATRLLSKEERAAVHQRVELESEAAVTVGTTTQVVVFADAQRISRALRLTQRHRKLTQQQRNASRRRSGGRHSSSRSFAGGRQGPPSLTGLSPSRFRASSR